MENTEPTSSSPEEIEWIFDLKQAVLGFLENMEVSPGRFRYSLSGDLPPLSAHWGLGNTVFAIKIYHLLGHIPTLPLAEQAALTSFLLSFQNQDGSFSDSYLLKRSFFSNILFALRHLDFQNLQGGLTVRAETRQTLSALKLLHQTPEVPYRTFPNNEQSIGQYLDRLDWTRPWAAGSHFSHLLFFLEQSTLSNKDLLIDTAIAWLSTLAHESDGTWYRGTPSLREKINGAMKIITGLKAAHRLHLPHAEKLIDTCLTAANDEHACDNFNIIYVLRAASDCHDRTYRQQEISDFCYNRLSIYREYYFPEHGGFSFLKGHANDRYYGARVSRGLPEPDIHGTLMFLWGISEIARLLSFNDRLKFQEIIP